MLVPGRDIEMAIGDQRIREPRGRLLAASVALGAAALGLSTSGFGASAATAASPDKEPSSTTVVECSSGITTLGDVQTSSSYVARVPAGEHPDLPGGCVLTG